MPPATPAGIPDFLTPETIATSLKVSVDTVVRRFEDRPGVLNLGTEETRFKRRKRILRIPREVFDLYLAEHQKRN